jgi:hypothetical protein
MSAPSNPFENPWDPWFPSSPDSPPPGGAVLPQAGPAPLDGLATPLPSDLSGSAPPQPLAGTVGGPAPAPLNTPADGMGLPSFDSALWSPITESWAILPRIGAKSVYERPEEPSGASSGPLGGDAWFPGMRALSAFHPSPPPVFEIDHDTLRPHVGRQLPAARSGRTGRSYASPGLVRTCPRCGKELDGDRCDSCSLSWCPACGEVMEPNSEGRMVCPACFGDGNESAPGAETEG